MHEKGQYCWTRHKVGIPRIVSTRVTLLPIVPKSVLRQHVVRITSVQSLDPRSRDTESSENEYAAGEKKRMVEYLVLQRRIFKGKEGPWLVWGTVQETEAGSVLVARAPQRHAPLIDVVKAT